MTINKRFLTGQRFFACLILSAMPFVSSCDKLWGGFSTADPEATPEPGPDAFRLDKIEPNHGNWFGGMWATVYGLGLTADTVVTVGGNRLLSSRFDAQAGTISGQIPGKSAPARCSEPSEVALSKPNYPTVKQPGMFTYQFEIYSANKTLTAESVKAQIHDMLVADFDGDGKKDIVFLNQSTPGGWKIETISNVFSEPNNKIQTVLTGEIKKIAGLLRNTNQTSKPELLLYNAAGVYSYSYETSDWSQGKVAISTVGLETRKVLIADLNGDGKNDEIVTITKQATSPESITIRELSAETYTAVATFTAPSEFRAATVVKESGKPDRVAVLGMNNKFSIIQRSGTTYDLVSENICTTRDVGSVTSGDYDQNGTIDYAFYGEFTGTNPDAKIHVCLQKSTGGFELKEFPLQNMTSSQYQVQLDTVDLGCDKLPEIVLNNLNINSSSRLFVLKNKGQGSFEVFDPIQTPADGPVVFADVNGDQLTDVVIGRNKTVSGTTSTLSWRIAGY